MSHGMARAMGELLHLPHGRGNAILLPHVIAFNAGLGEQGDFPARARYAKLSKLAGCCCYNETVAVQSLVKKIGELMAEVGMPRKLESEEHRTLVTEHLDALAKAALADRCTAGNPRQAQPEQIMQLYQKLV